ncbi:MAG: aspartate/glutamate racemase family protein [Kineosporiaceae bacterium]
MIGVLGGIGPLATAFFLERVVRLTDAARDQDHVDLVVLQHATVPDRTDFLLGRSGDDPGPVLAADARRLAAWGATAIVLPCNTADAFRDRLLAAVDVPVVSIVERTVTAALAGGPVEAVGVLATEGTVAAGVYAREIAERGGRQVLPSEDDQRLVMEIIYGQVKRGQPSDAGTLRAVVGRLREAGAERVVLGCTELSVAAGEHGLLADPAVVDSVETLAADTVRRAGRRLRPDLGRPS